MNRFFARSPATLGRAEYMGLFGGVFEHSPWVAEAARAEGLEESDREVATFHARLCRHLHAASPERQLALIRAHPDLAGKAAIEDRLSADSRAEQNSAGLDRCSPAEFALFQRYNAAYKARFGFPFILAVKNRSRAEILAAFERRLDHTPEAERSTALAEIEKIALFRLEEIATRPSFP